APRRRAHGERRRATHPEGGRGVVAEFCNGSADEGHGRTVALAVYQSGGCACTRRWAPVLFLTAQVAHADAHAANDSAEMNEGAMWQPGLGGNGAGPLNSPSFT